MTSPSRYKPYPRDKDSSVEWLGKIPHQLSAADEEDFAYYVIADNPRGDSCYYPDSGKWVAFKEGSEEVIAKGAETDYYDGEE